MAGDHFLQAAARITLLVRSRQSAEPAEGREVRALVSASSKGGEWRTKQAENAVSRSHPAWPLRHAAFSGNPGGDALAAYLRDSCEVRARCSVRVRSRTGRLRQSVLSSFHCLTFSSRGKLSPEPLRLTRPVGALAAPVRLAKPLHPLGEAGRVLEFSAKDRLQTSAVGMHPIKHALAGSRREECDPSAVLAGRAT